MQDLPERSGPDQLGAGARVRKREREWREQHADDLLEIQWDEEREERDHAK